MTENEIIKALDYCCENIPWEEDAECTKEKCYQCALPEDRDGDTRWCRQWLIKDALDLIKRKDAEIDILIRKKETLRDEIAELQIENGEIWEERCRIYENLKETQAQVREYRKAYTDAQAENERYKAEHKDFAKRLGNLTSMEIMVFDRAKELKAEAIKEFKARLINNIDDGELYNSNDDYWMTIQHINAVAKEMAEQPVNYGSSKIKE